MEKFPLLVALLSRIKIVMIRAVTAVSRGLSDPQGLQGEVKHPFRKWQSGVGVGGTAGVTSLYPLSPVTWDDLR